ncbi:MAG: hypothetical protein R6V27_16565 [Balneolaceae bacterium]
MSSEINLKYDLTFIAGAVIVLIPLFYLFSAESIRTMSYMLMLTSYLIGRYVGKKVSASSE